MLLVALVSYTNHSPIVDLNVVRDFNNKAFGAIRSIMGIDTHVFMGDTFDAAEWNTEWWTDPGHSRNYLDSHYFHGKPMCASWSTQAKNLFY